MNGKTIGAIMENDDVAMLAGHNVMYYSDSLKGDSVHKSFESHYKVFHSGGLRGRVGKVAVFQRS